MPASSWVTTLQTAPQQRWVGGTHMPVGHVFPGTVASESQGPIRRTFPASSFAEINAQPCVELTLPSLSKLIPATAENIPGLGQALPAPGSPGFEDAKHWKVPAEAKLMFVTHYNSSLSAMFLCHHSGGRICHHERWDSTFQPKKWINLPTQPLMVTKIKRAIAWGP